MDSRVSYIVVIIHTYLCFMYFRYAQIANALQARMMVRTIMIQPRKEEEEEEAD